MTAVDRFTCRREGHVPQFVPTNDPARVVVSAYSRCQRCGEWFQVDLRDIATEGVAEVPSDQRDTLQEGA